MKIPLLTSWIYACHLKKKKYTYFYKVLGLKVFMHHFRECKKYSLMIATIKCIDRFSVEHWASFKNYDCFSQCCIWKHFCKVCISDLHRLKALQIAKEICFIQIFCKYHWNFFCHVSEWMNFRARYKIRIFEQSHKYSNDF